jgi:hypothetical protein
LITTLQNTPSQQIPPQVRQAIDKLAKVAQVGDELTGWVWIGPAANSNLLGSGGRQVSPSSIRKGQTYTARSNLTIREGPPNRNNASAPTVGIISSGDRIRALAAPTLAPGGASYWLQVALVPTGPAIEAVARVVPQFAVENTRGDDLRQQLIQGGYTVDRAEILKNAAGLNEVRYCYDSDAGKAYALAAEVRAALGRPIEVQKLSGCDSMRPRTLELWVGEP